MEMGCSISQHFIVELPRAEGTPDCRCDLCHFGEVGVPCDSVELMEFVKTRFGEEETLSTEVLVRIQPDVSRRQSCNAPHPLAEVLRGIVCTDVARPHARNNSDRPAFRLAEALDKRCPSHRDTAGTSATLGVGIVNS